MPGAPSNQPCLTVLGGPMSGTLFVIEDAVDNILIGSDSSCKFCIPLPGVSPIHARIWLDAGGAIVYDTHSPRGLYVNDDRVDGEAALKNGDILWLGTPGEDAVVMIQCRLPRPAPAPEPLQEMEPSEATLVMASETVTARPEESEFYVEVEAPEPSPVEATTVLAGPPDQIAEPFAPFSEVPDAPRLSSEPPTPAAALEFEDETSEAAAAASTPAPEAPRKEEDETIAVPPARPPDPTPIPAPAPPPAKAEPISVRPAPPAARPPASPRPAAAPQRPAPTPVPRPAQAASASPAKGIALGAGILAVVVVGGFFAWRLVPARQHGSGDPDAGACFQQAAGGDASRAAARDEATHNRDAGAGPARGGGGDDREVTVAKGAEPKPVCHEAQPVAERPRNARSGGDAGGPVAEEQRAQQLAAQVAGLLGQADAAAPSRPEEALRLYDEVLKLEPQNGRALAGKAATQGAAAASRKRFAAGRTAVQSAKSKGDLSGFDSADVQVADAPGRIDFEATPASIKPGDSYTVRIFFANESKKAIKVKSLSVSTLANGARAGGPTAAKVREIGPGQRALVSEATGVWKDGTNAWSLDVVLASERNDSYRNQLSWR